MDETRILPTVVELEEAVLGALLLEFGSQETLKVMDVLQPEYWFKDAHRIIYAAIVDMYRQAHKIDILTVTQYCRAEGTLKDVGGAYYISVLTNRIASSSNIEFHAYMIVQSWMHREVIRIGSTAVNRAYNQDQDIFGLIDNVEEILVMRDRLVKNNSEIQHVKDLLGMETQDYDDRAASALGKRSHGVPTGLFELDKTTNGWQRSKVYLLGARPAMGKTSFAVGVAVYSAIINHTPTAVFSLEMSAVELIQRIVCDLASVDNEVYNSGKLTPVEINRIEQARHQLSQSPLYIDDTPNLSIIAFRSKARRLKAKYEVQFVVVDYIQLMSGSASGRKNNNREQEISEISRGMKACAKELDIPILELSQLSRGVETRGGDKRPQLSDLRESGSLEQDADVVLFLHRPEYYGQLTDHNGDSTVGKAELIFAKHRGGKLGTVDMRFEGKHTRFSNWGEHWHNPNSGLSPNEAF